jgi:type IX secretion system PorP/SprF family membrane protein
MKKNIIIPILLTLLAGGGVNGQRATQFSQYVYTQALQNPAYTGTRGAVSALLIHRNQWLGIQGAPKTSALNIHMPVGNTQSGVGIALINENIGFYHKLKANLAYAYRLKIADDNFISLGLQGGVDKVSFTPGEMINITEDLLILDASEGSLNPQAGVGLLYYSKRAFFGASLPEILLESYEEDKVLLEELHYFIYGGYLFDLSSQAKLKPSAFAKNVKGAPVEVELLSELLMQDKYSFSLGYRTRAAVLFGLSFKLGNMWGIGYAYDYPITDMVQASNGSHEIRVTYDLKRLTDIMNGGSYSPRYF